MSDHTKTVTKNEHDALSKAEAARLAGAIWMYGGIHIAGDSPRIVITMPIPLVYKYQQDFGGKVYRGKKGYFTLQIGDKLHVERALKMIEPYMGGSLEAEQVRIALAILALKRQKKLSDEDRAQIRGLVSEWQKCKEELEQWMRHFVETHSDKKSKPIPFKIWSRAYAWAKFMMECDYEFVPMMLPLEEARRR